jgi:uncharacterized protein YkwD
MRAARACPIALALLLSATIGRAGPVERLDPFPAYSPSAEDAATAKVALAEAVQSLTAGKLDEAEKSAREAAHLIPPSAAPIVLLALIAEKREHTADAVDLYREALSWDPADETALAALERLKAPRYGDTTTVYEDQLVWYINQSRAAQGLGALKPHPALAEVARAHSAAMRDLSFFAHESPKRGERTTLDRFLKRFEGCPAHLAENLARRYWRPTPALNQENIAISHQELMHSPAHRKNILDPTVEYVGVGIAVNAEGDYWVTELFLTPRPDKDSRMVIQGSH